MKKYLFIVMAFLFPLFLSAQEFVAPPCYGIKLNTKTISECRLPFFDDFSNYEGTPNPSIWATTDPFVSKGYGEYPPTIGVVTLDAVDASGVLHQGASTSPFSGDTLRSCYIRLDSIFKPKRALHPADSIYLSFYYLPGGGSGDMWDRNGDMPEFGDSLILEFYNPHDSIWQYVWSVAGISVDTLIARTGHAWQFVSIPILDDVYFNRQFQFRFRNFCTLDDMAKTGIIGNSDHWHLDYIYLDYNRHRNDEYQFDVAFVEPASSLLKEYKAMPARQYTDDDMRDSVSLVITNRYSEPMATRYTYTVIDENGNAIANYDGGNDNAPTYFPDGAYQTAPAHANPVVNFSYPQQSTPRTYEVVHVVRGSVANDNHPQNDTIRFTQVFDNYYAYDDGVAENGYGLTSTSSRVRLAYSFSLNKKDTLTAIDLYFNRTRNNENEFIYFNLCIWDEVDGQPGNLLYKDTERRLPQFKGLNQYVRYVLEDKVVVEGNIYVGFEQASNDFINIGFDRGFDASRRIYYHTSGKWQQSILKGALMMRPYFGHSATVDIPDVDSSPLRVYPNPASGIVHIEATPNAKVQLYNIKGQLIFQQTGCTQIDVSQYTEGVYILRIIDELPNSIVSQKLVIQ